MSTYICYFCGQERDDGSDRYALREIAGVPSTQDTTEDKWGKYQKICPKCGRIEHFYEEMVQLRKDILRRLDDFNHLRLETEKDLNEAENDVALYHINEFLVKVQPKLRHLEAIGKMALLEHKFVKDENYDKLMELTDKFIKKEG